MCFHFGFSDLVVGLECVYLDRQNMQFLLYWNLGIPYLNLL